MPVLLLTKIPGLLINDLLLLTHASPGDCDLRYSLLHSDCSNYAGGACNAYSQGTPHNAYSQGGSRAFGTNAPCSSLGCVLAAPQRDDSAHWAAAVTCNSLNLRTPCLLRSCGAPRPFKVCVVDMIALGGIVPPPLGYIVGSPARGSGSLLRCRYLPQQRPKARRLRSHEL
jgi:hypothetical protein